MNSVGPMKVEDHYPVERPVLVVGQEYRYMEGDIARAIVTLKNIVGKHAGGEYDYLQLAVDRPLEGDDGFFYPGVTFDVYANQENVAEGWALKRP